MTTRKLPFNGKVGYKPQEVANRFTGEKVTIPSDAVAVYNTIMGAELFRDYDKMLKGYDWFRKHEPDALTILTNHLD